jgi:penicillin-binding protein 1B
MPRAPKKAAEAAPAADPVVKLARKAAPPKASRPKARKKKAPPSGGGGWGRWLRDELLLWSAAIGVGLAGVTGLAALDAQDTVRATLTTPPAARRGVVWSAPARLAPGMPLQREDVERVLLGAGYDRVDGAPGADQFRRVDDGLEINTAARDGVPGGAATVSFGDGITCRPACPVIAPTRLATFSRDDASPEPIRRADLGPWIEPAVLAIEDSRFYRHPGVDPIGIGRALVHDLTSPEEGLHGGSTITMQLVKNELLTPDRTLRRKVRELFLSLALEQQLGKTEILERYLSGVYLGQAGGTPLHGVDAAARAWFGKGVAELSPEQAATIAGVIASPNTWSPTRHPERAVARRDDVLDRMRATGALDEAAWAAAKARPLEVTGMAPRQRQAAPWAVDAVMEHAERSLGDGAVAADGYRVFTTIDPILQQLAERAVARGAFELDRTEPTAKGAEIALVAVRVSDGAVVAMVGGRDWSQSPFNRVTAAERQPGSLVKPLVALAALDADPDLTPLTRVDDVPVVRKIDGKPWSPQNYDGRYLGSITLRRALESSRNAPAVLLAEQLGWADAQAFLRRAGLDGATRLPSVALGAFPATPMEVAGAYTAFAGGGVARVPYLLAEVTTAEGVQVLGSSASSSKVASPRAAAMATAMLEGVIDRGTARAASVGPLAVTGAVAGKTGTTDGYRDAWFAGFTPDLVVVVWVGRDRSGDVGLTGGQAALPTWSYFMQAIGPSPAAFPRADGLVSVSACPDSGRAARPGCPAAYVEWLPKGSSPAPCDVHGGPAIVAVGPAPDAARREKAEHEPNERGDDDPGAPPDAARPPRAKGPSERGKAEKQ